MFAYKDNKVYAKKENILVGVDIYSDRVIPVDGTETSIWDGISFITLHEIRCKFQVSDSNSYVFPRESKTGVIPSEPIKPAKRTTRKSSSK